MSLFVALSVAQSADYSQYVNVFLGTENGGNMFPGVVAAPFAMVKLGPDVTNFTTDAYSGYLPVGNITGFSLMHESGTGGAPKYGVVSQMPVLGAVPNPLVDLGTNRSGPDQGAVGYYKTSLANGIIIEVAATEHAGFYQYTFPAGGASVVVDVSHVLNSFRGLGWGQNYTNGRFGIMRDGHYEGRGTYNNGWNLAPNWDIYFCGYFDAPATSSRTFSGNGTTLASYGRARFTTGKMRQGGVFSFNRETVTSRVGISFISAERACQNVQKEIPRGTTLKTLSNTASSRWNSEVFSKITTTETNSTILTQLYSSLYGMHLIPSNRTGENPLWKSHEPYYDDVFTQWDLFRCSTPLMHVLQPAAYEEQLRSLIDIWRHEGFLPDARSSNYNGRTQGGSNSDNVLADAYVKGVRGAVNWTDGYAAMRTDAEVTPPNNNDPIALDSSTKEGRGALPDWLRYGYITPTYSRAVSRAVEYSVNDFGLRQVAMGLNLGADSAKYLNRSRNWRNHWNPVASSLNFTGFVVPRYANGSFAPYDPLQCGGCYWKDPYYQGLPWEYSFNAHHDMAHLIDLAGGPATFTRRLTKMFEPGIAPANKVTGGMIFNPANEPSFTTPYLFNFVGRQDLSVYYSRMVAKKYYNAGRSGIPGNSDAGAMQTWLLWNMIGLYPLTGQSTFLIGSPWFSQTIALAAGKTLNITVTHTNTNANATVARSSNNSSSNSSSSDAAYYVQSLAVNGKPWTKAWIAWSDVFEHGGTMDFALGAEPVRWATGELPPSPAS
ncbi:hypothetical protein B0A49_08371 [Cryomyces minteri]|uniref:Glycosyl hydrolase family 92 domain-containing protein n=1 Tax=Cryomyces minteri TaxID=331657 RepID=A0A4U0WN74_9PEZI|nr:hypothetical protein B0A49_08371 [Cryomyces minteri]